MPDGLPIKRYHIAPGKIELQLSFQNNPSLASILHTPVHVSSNRYSAEFPGFSETVHALRDTMVITGSSWSLRDLQGQPWHPRPACFPLIRLEQSKSVRFRNHAFEIDGLQSTKSSPLFSPSACISLASASAFAFIIMTLNRESCQPVFLFSACDVACLFSRLVFQ